MNAEQRAALRNLTEEAVSRNSTSIRYMAATSPQVILQLLDYIELLEQVESNLCNLHNEALKHIETLEKDGARYRWLRDTCMDDPKTRLAVMNGFIDYETVDYVYGEGMDVAIDAAMKG